MKVSVHRNEVDQEQLSVNIDPHDVRGVSPAHRVRAHLGRIAAATAATSSLVLPVAIWTWRHNMPGDFVALLILAADFWFAYFLVALPFVTAVHLAAIRSSSVSPFRRDFAGGVAVLFFLLWFVRMEPAHQMFSVKPHLSVEGMIDIGVVTALSFLVYVAGTQRKKGLRFTSFAAALMGCVALEAFARSQEPTRSRDAAILEVPRTLGPVAATGTAPPKRVLMIGVDGMDWRVVAGLLRAGKLPAIAKLLGTGRYYQLDNLRMRLSPEIWTAAYTGVEAGQSGVDSFLRWRFAGISKPLIELPKFGVHSVLFTERVLWDLRPLHLWSGRPVSTLDFTAPPVWTILSEGNRRVAVIDPLPMDSLPEQVSGVFILANTEHVLTFSSKGQEEIALPQVPRLAPGIALAQWERTRVATISSVLRRDHYDAAVYYTHFLDGIQHQDWDSAPGSIAPSILNGYIEADGTISALIDAFGQPATVILLSDHGWDFNEYEHFMSPRGVLAVSPSGNPGYGGNASVLRVPPTVLSIAGVSPSASMEPALSVGQAPVRAAFNTRVIKRKFYDATITDHEMMKRLHALGYIGR